jgi:hypothetical protein
LFFKNTLTPEIPRNQLDKKLSGKRLKKGAKHQHTHNNFSKKDFLGNAFLE